MRNLHKETTDRIIAALKAGTIPWRQPWSGFGSGAMPRNAITNRAYSGANVVLLWLTAQERGYDSPLWLTYKQAEAAGGNVRKGEKSTQIIFVSFLEKQDIKTGKMKKIPFLKSFNVFNVAQCESINGHEPKVINNEERDILAEEFVTATQATIRHGGSRACYIRSLDVIDIPMFESFKNAAAYYGTTFHELAHWTGHEARLNRTKGKRFGDQEYSFEELVAELSSAFICAEFGYDNTLEDSAAYIAHWVKFLQDHEGAFVAAASSASQAVEYMRSLAIADEPEALAEAA